MKQVFYIIRLATIIIYCLAVVFGVIGLPVLFLTDTPIKPTGYIGVTYLLISLIFITYNVKNVWFLGEDYKQMALWQIILMTILSFMLLLTLMFAVL